MNHCVPVYEVDEDYLLQDSSSLKRHKKSAMGDEDIMELLWQNGQVVMQSQNQRSTGNKKLETMPSTAVKDLRSGVVQEELTQTPCNLFMQEDEMISWLHYPCDDNSLDLYLPNNDIMYPVLPSSAPVTTAPSSLPPSPPLVTAPSSRPPIPPLKRMEQDSNQPNFANFLHFSKPNKRNLAGSAPSSSNKISQTMTQLTVMESKDRSAAEALQSRASRVTDSAAFVSGPGCRGSMSSFGGAGTSSAGREPETCDLTASSSPCTGGSLASASVEPSSQKPPPATDNRKRKGRDIDETECYSEDVEFEYHEAKKQSRGSSSTKRSRAAEVHNLSERRRRDRINEKMKALQELIPRCNKSDKASMLDEAIEYLKSLQMQVQMMSMGYNMVPMMFPGVQQYMQTMGSMGMGMDHVGMNRPIIPFPTVLNPTSTMPNPAAHFPVPRFQMSPVIGPTRSQGAPNPINVFPLQSPNQPRIPFPDPYQHYISPPQTQLPRPQNQTSRSAVTTKPSSNKDGGDPNSKRSLF